MVRAKRRVPILLALAAVAGCDRVLERVGLGDDAPAVTIAPAEPSDDARALAIAVGSMVPGSDAAPTTVSAPAVATPPAVITDAGLDELDLYDVAVEWKPSSTSHHYYYGSGEAPDVLSFSAKARTRKPVGTKAEITIKATCDDGPAKLTDAETARIDDSVAGLLPIEGTEFRLAQQLFTKTTVTEATACRVVVALRDPAKTPQVRGSISLCWTAGSKAPIPCAAPVPEVPVAEQWALSDVQFLPTNEMGFAVVAGTAPAPDRLGIRATCHVGDKHFVEFQYVDAKLAALEPGDTQRHTKQVTAAWEYMRFADCDVEVQAVSYDVAADKLLGVTEIGRRCMRPSGIREGRCSQAAVELMLPDPSGVPVVATIQNSSFTSYGGWYGAYAMGELTLRAPLPKDSRFEFVAACGKKVERMPLVFPTPMELIYPGQSLRAQGSVSGRGRPKPQTCTTEFILHTKDEVGLEREWSLGKQCYGKSGTSVPCRGAPPAPPPTGLGFSGIGGVGWR